MIAILADLEPAREFFRETMAPLLQEARDGKDYSMTHSCYDPVDGRACGHCDACRLRLKGFAEAGVQDPGPYAS